MKIKRGSTSVRRLIFVADSSSTTGAGLANLVYNTASLVAYYFAGDLSNEVQITLATATLGTFASGGFIAVDNTNMPGWYEIGIPDAALDGGIECAIQFRGAANMVPVNVYIELDAFDYQTATQPVNVTQFGGANLTATAGIPSVNTTQVSGTAQTAGDIYASQVAIAGYIDTEVSAIKAKTDNLPSDPADQSAVEAAITAATSPLATQASVNTIDDFLDTEIAAIKTKTDQLTFTTANKVDSTAVLDSAVRVKLDGTQPDYAPATASALTTVGNNVTAILEDTGTTIPAQITALNNLSSAQVVSALGTGTWATALPWNAAWDAEVQSEVQDAIEVNNLDHLVKIAVDTNFATTVHLDSIIGHMADNGTTATFSRTTDSLEAIRDNQTAVSGASLPDIIAGVQSVSGAIVEAQNSATLSIRIGDTWTQDIESLGDLTDKTVSFALKKRASDADTAAIVFIVEGTGLTKLNGAATTAGWGSITILDEVAGDIRLRLESNATSLLTSGSYVDAVKVLENGDDRTLRNAGRTVVSAGVIADIT